jgi:predicted enzyme related to lactoylglutathione lyase
VPDLEAGLAFYRDSLGHELIWRTETAAGLRFPELAAELVIHTENEGQEVDFLVDSAESAAERIEKAGGKLLMPPFDVQIGRYVVVEDP